MKVVGVDPGLSGAVAVMVDGEITEVHDVPTFTIVTGAGKKRRLINEVALLKILKPHRDARLCMLEKVWAMPKQGVSSSFSFGRVFGQISMAIAAAGIKKEEISAQHWKRMLVCSADADEARARATELLPRAAAFWPLKKHDGRAEAALLAYLAWEKLNGRLQDNQAIAA